MRVFIVFGALALSLSGCDRLAGNDDVPRAQGTKPREQVRSECASQLTYARLKEYVFDEAARIRNSDPRRLDRLAAYSVVRMDEPVVKSRDDRLNITVCTGQFVLNLPPGIRDAFDEEPVIEADVEYAAQAAADGSGLVYSMSGAEPIIYRIATLGLPTHQAPHFAPTPPLAGADNDTAEVLLPEPNPETRSPTTPVVVSGQGQITATANQIAPGQRDAARPVQANGSPSFNCKYAKTSSEKAVCRSGSLAAADRQMAAVYYSEMASASAPTKNALRRTRDRFLAKRERCSSEACMARVYEDRIAEIRRLTRQ